MTLECIFEIAQDHVICNVFGQFTVEEGVRVIQSTVDTCGLNGFEHALIDATAIKHPVLATKKIIAAYKVEELLNDLLKMGQALPRIAIFGTAPFIGIYKPASEYFQLNSIPIRVFDSQSSAKEWLFAVDAK